MEWMRYLQYLSSEREGRPHQHFSLFMFSKLMKRVVTQEGRHQRRATAISRIVQAIEETQGWQVRRYVTHSCLACSDRVFMSMSGTPEPGAERPGSTVTLKKFKNKKIP
jgi:hypothetical protein